MKNFISRNFVFILYITILVVTWVVVIFYIKPRIVEETVQYTFDKSMENARLNKDSAQIMLDSCLYFEKLDSVHDSKRCIGQAKFYIGKGIGNIELFKSHKK